MFKKLLFRVTPIDKRRVIIVSGLPRSGTSMMMKMLAEGGLPLLTDSLRQADEDNPNGYYEIEQSKKLKEGEVQWLFDARGKVVKVISYLLEHLPNQLDYDIIFMERNIREVLVSQKKMLLNQKVQSSISDDDLALLFQKHLLSVRWWIASKPNMRVMYVDYNQMVNDPGVLCSSLATFLKQSLDIRAMQAVPDLSLYRNRA